MPENNTAEKPKRVYRDISQKYCSRIDDNVIIVREAGAKTGDYECLSSHLCGGNAQCSINHSAEAVKPPETTA